MFKTQPLFIEKDYKSTNILELVAHMMRVQILYPVILILGIKHF